MKHLLSTANAAAMLGVSRRTFRLRIGKNLTMHRIGRRHFYLTSDVVKLKRCEVS